MSNLLKAALWASAIIVSALAAANGFIPSEAGKVLVTGLPALAALSIGNVGTCVRGISA